MSESRHPPRDSHGRPLHLPGLPAPAAAAPAPRVQPPLQEVLKGLDARELEGETVFDQLFGPLPDGDPRPPGG